MSITAKNRYINGEKNPFFGKKHSEETKKKMSQPKTKSPCPHCVLIVISYSVHPI